MAATDIPQAVRGEVTSVQKRLLDLLGDNLHACILYGSAVRGNFTPGRSDINLLIVLNEPTPEAHFAIADAIGGKGTIAPFVVSRRELVRTRQVFTLKFLSIGRNYCVLHGDDVLAGFTADPAILSFQCEQSLRNQRLRFTHAFITAGGDATRYARFLAEALPGLFVALSEPVRSAGQEIPKDYQARIPVFTRVYGTDCTVLADLVRIKATQPRLSREETFGLHNRLFSMLSDTLEWVKKQWPATLIKP